jgi:25S rRNA (uracil2634-N3)-methyltransferase
LILGFLRSAANLLALGPIPSFTASSKKKKKLSEEDDDDEDNPMPPPEETFNAEGDDKYEFFLPDDTVPSRGTIQITLRNVSPYTLW